MMAAVGLARWLWWSGSRLEVHGDRRVIVVGRRSRQQPVPMLGAQVRPVVVVRPAVGVAHQIQVGLVVVVDVVEDCPRGRSGVELADRTLAKGDRGDREAVRGAWGD